MIKKMFKLPDHSKFNYEPRFYDPEKEELERRIRLARMKTDSEEEFEKRIRSIKFEDRLRTARANDRFYARVAHQKTMSRVRLFIILNILLIITIFAIYKLL